MRLWHLESPGQEPLTVRAEPCAGAFDDVEFTYADGSAEPRVIRTLGTGQAHLEWWTEDDNGRFTFEPDTQRPTDATVRAFELANSLSEEHVLDLCRSFAAVQSVAYQARLDEAVARQHVAQSLVSLAEKELDAAVARESSLELQPGPLKDAAIALARTWLGDTAGLLIAAEGTIRPPEETP